MGILKKPSTEPEPQPEDDTEQKRIIRWRRLQLARAGYSMKASGVLADATHVDIEAARKLILKCPEELAVDILL